MTTILLPTDFSRKDQNAVRYAIQLFGREPIQFILFHCPDSPTSGTDLKLSALNSRSYRESRSQQRSELRALRHAFPQENLAFEVVNETGSMEYALERFTRDNAVDFVIIGKRRATWLEKVVPGWKIRRQRLTARLDCPVLIVPEDATPPASGAVGSFQRTDDQRDSSSRPAK